MGRPPGHSRQELGSGIGFVPNAFPLEDTEKTVPRAPFTPAPRGLVTGDLSPSPRSPYFVTITNRTAPTTVERVIRFTAAPSVMKLPAARARSHGSRAGRGGPPRGRPVPLPRNRAGRQGRPVLPERAVDGPCSKIRAYLVLAA
ncbi:hypothetical protein [Streptomyces sp. NPDC051109]|uniref:hypothetical protein n=1 Tax=Streptomyces sp. NPDC051109 TaxID=3365642 RepID=UPI0037AB5E77